MRIIIRPLLLPPCTTGGARGGADAAFFGLAGLAAIILGMLAGSVIEYLSHYTAQLRVACEGAWTILRSHALTGPALLPTAILVVIVSAGGLALLRQLQATRRLIGAIRCQRMPLPERLQRAASALGMTDRVELVADERVYSFCYGLLSPRICITAGLLELLDDEELDALLLHERHHLLCRDPLKVLLSRTWASGLFFLPLAQDLRDRYLRAKEIEADDVTASDGDRQMPLASALLKVLTSERRLRYPGRGTPCGCPGQVQDLPLQKLAAIGAFGLSVTEERIERLVSPRRIPPSFSLSVTGRAGRGWGRGLVSALIVSLIILASLNPFFSPAVPRGEMGGGECTNVGQVQDPSRTGLWLSYWR